MPTMMTRTTGNTPGAGETLLLALDLGNHTWKLGFTVGGGALPPRIRPPRRPSSGGGEG